MLNFITKLFRTTTVEQEDTRRITMNTTTKETYRTYKSRWGYHPVSYETHLKLKELNKWYFETLRRLGCWVRWDRKTVYKHGPEPKYCPVFVEDKPEWRKHVNKDGNVEFRYYPKTRNDLGIHEAYHTTRVPKATPEEVEPLELSAGTIDSLHAKVKAWFDEN